MSLAAISESAPHVIPPSPALRESARGLFQSEVNSTKPHHWFCAGVDFLLLLGFLRDLVVTKRIHPVYVYALPLLALGQKAIIHAFVTGWPVWSRIARALLV